MLQRDEIIEMARQAGFIVDDNNPVTHSLKAFAKLVEERTAAKEREACLKIQDECQYSYGNDLAKAIRARGEQ